MKAMTAKKHMKHKKGRMTAMPAKKYRKSMKLKKNDKKKAAGPLSSKTVITVKNWDTTQVDDGWQGELVGLSWNKLIGSAEEKWHWRPPKP